MVYEPFLGSGTTLIAELTERSCCGLELDPKFVDVIIQRWQQVTGKQALMEGGSATFQEVRDQRRRESTGPAQPDAAVPSELASPRPRRKRKLKKVAALRSQK